MPAQALSEELENPLNVHRWRKLEGSDPSTYEMIQKIQTLQKRLIAKTEEVGACLLSHSHTLPNAMQRCAVRVGALGLLAEPAAANACFASNRYNRHSPSNQPTD